MRVGPACLPPLPLRWGGLLFPEPPWVTFMDLWGTPLRQGPPWARIQDWLGPPGACSHQSSFWLLWGGDASALATPRAQGQARAGPPGSEEAALPSWKAGVPWPDMLPAGQSLGAATLPPLSSRGPRASSFPVGAEARGSPGCWRPRGSWQSVSLALCWPCPSLPREGRELQRPQGRCPRHSSFIFSGLAGPCHWGPSGVSELGVLCAPWGGPGTC